MSRQPKPSGQRLQKELPPGRSKEYFAQQLVEEFHGMDRVVEEYTVDGELLGHCFFPAAISVPLERLLLAGTDGGRIRKYVRLIHEMYLDGDEAVQNIVEVSLLEFHALGPKEALARLWPHLPPDLAELTKMIKNTWGSWP